MKPKVPVLIKSYLDGTLIHEAYENRVVFEDAQGKYINISRAKKYFVQDNPPTVETHARTVRMESWAHLKKQLGF